MATKLQPSNAGRLKGRHPLYKQIASTLRDEIQRDYTEDQVLPPQRRLAERFNTSYVTIGNALKELVNEGLVERTVGSGTRVCTKESARRGLVGILTSMKDPVYMSQMFGAMEAVLRKSRFRPILFGGSMDYEEEKRAFQEMGSIKELGLIIYSFFHHRFSEEIARLRSKNIPGVAILRPIEGLDLVRVDHRFSGTLQAQFVAEAGFRDILYIGRTGVEFADLEMNGFATGAADSNLDVQLCCVENKQHKLGELAEEELKEQIIQIIDARVQKKKPEVIITFGDRYLPVICTALRQKGIDPSKDVVLVGADNQNLPGLPYVSVEHRHREVGTAAAQMLIERIDGKYNGPERTVTITPQLIRHGI